MGAVPASTASRFPSTDPGASSSISLQTMHIRLWLCAKWSKLAASEGSAAMAVPRTAHTLTAAARVRAASSLSPPPPGPDLGASYGAPGASLGASYGAPVLDMPPQRSPAAYLHY